MKYRSGVQVPPRSAGLSDKRHKFVSYHGGHFVCHSHYIL